MRLRPALATLVAALALAGCATTPPEALRGTGDLGVVIERAAGRVQIVEHSTNTSLATVPGLGDLSHAHVTFSRDGRFAYVFGRDGGLTKVDLLARRIDKRIIQAGNSIGGSISQDGRLIVAQNYEPGGIKAFDADTLELLSEVPAEYAPGKFSKVVGLADVSGQRFVYALFEAGEIWVTDFTNPRRPTTTRYPAGKQPYDGLVTPDGRYFLAGLFGEDGISLLDLWQPERGATKILAGYGRGEQKLPVFKMPHLRGWSLAGGQAWLPAIGRHEVLVADARSWQETARVPVKGQPVFVMARPDGRQVWVNFAFPDNEWVQVIDTVEKRVVHTFSPGKAVLHMEFEPRGEEVWLSSRDSNRVSVINTTTFATRSELPADAPSGIFFTARGQRIGF